MSFSQTPDRRFAKTASVAQVNLQDARWFCPRLRRRLRTETKRLTKRARRRAERRLCQAR